MVASFIRRISFENGDISESILGEMRLCSRAMKWFSDRLLERVRSRVGAYVYGNILVLAAILATSPESVAHWTAVIFVIATTATTFLAHVVAHRIGQAIGRTDDEALRLHLAQEVRDAVPIMTSGTPPPCSSPSAP